MIMKTKYLIFLLLCFNLAHGQAQKTNLKFLGVEGGITLVQHEANNMDLIRQDVIPYYYQTYTSAGVITSMRLVPFGIKTEFLVLKKKLGISAGIRYTSMKSSILKDEGGTGKEYFYFRYGQDTLNTEYFRINEINQKSDWIGIPLEIRYFPFKPRFFRPFIKLGAEFNYCLRTITDVKFYDDAMGVYQQGIIDIFGEPTSFNSLLNFGIGFRMSKDKEFAFNLELRALSLFLTSKSSTIVNPVGGAGFQIDLQVPLQLKSKEKAK
jgi:hypothetical protein